MTLSKTDSGMPAPNLESVADHFRRRGEPKNASMFMPIDFEAGMFRPSQEYALQLLGEFDNNLRVLDIGCGVGWDALALCGSTNQVWGIDVVDDLLRVAQDSIQSAGKPDRISVQIMDAHHLEFPDNFFDLVFANSFLMWVDKETVLAECHRVLKPGGRAFFAMETTRHHPLLVFYRVLPAVSRRERLVRRLSVTEIAGLRDGFSDVHSKQFYLVAPLAYPLARRWGKSSIVQRMVKLLQYVDAGLLKSLPFLQRFAWVSVIQYVK